MHHGRRRNVTTFIVGLFLNGQIRKNLTKNGEPEIKLGKQKKKKKEARRRGFSQATPVSSPISFFFLSFFFFFFFLRSPAISLGFLRM